MGGRLKAENSADALPSNIIENQRPVLADVLFDTSGHKANS